MKQYFVVIETGKNNCSAYCPDVPGCIAAGKTVEETLKQMQDALCFHFEGLAQEDAPTFLNSAELDTIWKKLMRKKGISSPLFQFLCWKPQMPDNEIISLTGITIWKNSETSV